MTKKYYYIFLMSFATLLFTGCVSDVIPGEKSSKDAGIEIALKLNNYSIVSTSTKSAEVRATDVGTPEEQQVDNLYLFLFDSNGANAESFYVNASSFTGGTWSSSDKKIKLDMKQAQAGTRQVYIVANCADIQSQLSTVSTVDELKSVLENTAQPWSPDDLNTPIMMSGNKTHDFITAHVLTAVPLERTLAKVTMDITLKEEFQSVTTSSGGKTPEYQYRFVDFDKENYVLNPGSKDETDLVTSLWTDWTTADVTTDNNGKATGLKLATYLNERFTKGAKIEIQMFYNDGGLLPPPEFGFETYILPLPDQIKRNHWYKYDVEL